MQKRNIIGRDQSNVAHGKAAQCDLHSQHVHGIFVSRWWSSPEYLSAFMR